MAQLVVSLDSIEPAHLPGRDLRWLVNRETMGTEGLGMAVMDCPAYNTVRPCHSHKDTEEVLFVLDGEGEVWIDGKVYPFKKGDAVLFPRNSKHQTRNSGPGMLRTCSIFEHPNPPETYISYEGEGFDAVT